MRIHWQRKNSMSAVKGVHCLLNDFTLLYDRWDVTGDEHSDGVETVGGRSIDRVDTFWSLVEKSLLRHAAAL